MWRKYMRYIVLIYLIIFVLDGETFFNNNYLNSNHYYYLDNNNYQAIMDTESNNQGFLYNTNNRLFYVKASSVMDGEDFDPSDYFGQHGMSEDNNNDYGDEEDGDATDVAFSRLPMTVQDGVQYAYSSVRIRDQVSFFILPNSGVPVERRYNNYKYVYKQHALPLNEVATALTPVLSMSSVLATTTKGNLYLRHAKDPGGEQVWTNVTWRRHKIIGGGQFFNLGPSENKQYAYFVSATGSLLEYNILSIVVQRDDGAHIFTGRRGFASGMNWKNLGAPSDGGLIAVVGVFYRAENRKVIACINAMGKLVFNENQRWKEQPHPPIYTLPLTPYDDDKKEDGNGNKKKSNKNDNNNNKKNKFDKYNKKGKGKKSNSKRRNSNAGDANQYNSDIPSMKLLSMPAATLTGRAHENAPTIIFSLSTDGILYGTVQKKKGEWVFEDHACIVDRNTGMPSDIYDDNEAEDDEDDDMDDEDNDMDEDGSDVVAVNNENEKPDVSREKLNDSKPQNKLIRFVSAPSKAVLRNSLLSIFIVSDEGKLYERTMDLNVRGRWKWVLHGHPDGHRLSAAAPLVSHAGEIVCRTRKGLFALLHLWGYIWKWQIEKPPNAFIVMAPAIVGKKRDYEAEREAVRQMIMSQNEDGDDNNDDDKEGAADDGEIQEDSKIAETTNGFCAPKDLLEENHCTSGLDPMTIIPRMRLKDAYYVVLKSPEAEDGTNRFETREEINPKTKLRINVDAPPISYTVDPFDRRSPTFYNDNWGNCMVPAIALVIRTVNIFSPEKVGKPWSELIKETEFFSTRINKSATSHKKQKKKKHKKKCLKMPIRNVTSLLFHGGLDMKSSRRISAGARASFALASMADNSVFIVSPGGYVFERFWNQANWVYVRHGGLPNSPVIQVSTIRQGGTLFASTADGTLYQRIARGFSSPLVWKALPYKSSRFYHAGITSGTDRNRVYFLDHRGKIVVRLVKQHKWELGIPNSNTVVWTKDKRHRSYSLPVKEQDVLMKGVIVRRGGKMVDIAVIISWEELHDGLSFFLDTNGELWEYAAWLHRYTWHGTPDKNTKLSLHPAAVLPDSTAVGSLFFRTVDGRVVERYFNQFSGKWMWVDHYHPPIAKIASAPGAVLFNNRIHFVGTDGHLWALVFRVDDENGDGWTWIDSGIPGIPLALMRPVNIGQHGVGVLAINGKFAQRTLNSGINVWKWDVAEIPEGSSIGAPPGTSYCSHEVLSPMNCVRGNKGIQTIDLTNPTSEMYKELQAFGGEVDANGDFILKSNNANPNGASNDFLLNSRGESEEFIKKAKQHINQQRNAEFNNNGREVQYRGNQKKVNNNEGSWGSSWFRL